MEIFGESLSLGGASFLALAIFLALAFEFVNGFHDTANAVATVIYTKTLPPVVAVVWSGIWNLIGVLTSSGAVAFGVVALLPQDLVLNVTHGAGLAMIFSLLVSSILWNVGTWYLGLPASSSHTLIGSILGVGLAHSVVNQHSLGAGMNWAKAGEVGLSLLISPMLGFGLAALLLLTAKSLLRQPELYKPPIGNTPPPNWIRGLLVLTCTGVSFAHGSNDGQKGMGVIMLILVGLLPATYAINPQMDANAAHALAAESQAVAAILDRAGDSVLAARVRNLGPGLLGQGNNTDRRPLRGEIQEVREELGKFLDAKRVTGDDAHRLAQYRHDLRAPVDFIPGWVKVAVAFSLGLGTMIGWKRIVVTVGERIGKEHLSYAQGGAAELVAMGTIAVADSFGMPVSTTHVLSSGIAGTMAANRSGLQMGTLRNIMLAWVLTLPVCVLLGAALFAASLFFLGSVLRFQ